MGDLPGEAGTLEGIGEAIVTALKQQEDQRAISGGECAGAAASSCCGRQWGVGVHVSFAASCAQHSMPHLPMAIPQPAEGAAGVAKRGAGPAEPYGAKLLAAEIEPKRLKEMLTYPESWGPTEWGERRAGETGGSLVAIEAAWQLTCHQPPGPLASRHLPARPLGLAPCAPGRRPATTPGEDALKGSLFTTHRPHPLLARQ